MAADDLVEALPGQSVPAEVHEQVGLEPPAQEPRTATLHVDANGVHRRAAHGHNPFLRSLSASAQHPRLEVHVAELERDRLGRAQPARVHQLEQCAVAQVARVGTARLLQQLPDLPARQHLRERAATARARDRGRRVGVAHALAPQVPVEGTQAGRLAVDGGRRRRGAPIARGEPGQEVRQVGGGRRGGVGAVLSEEAAELEQVRAVRLERVARQAALELEVGEEVEHEMLERGSLRLRRDSHQSAFARGTAIPAAASGCSDER